MKNCSNQKIRIYLMVNEDESHFEIFPENDIRKEYCLDGCFYVNPDYDPNDEPSEWNRKYLPYDPDDFETDPEEKVFDSLLNRDEETSGDHSLYCDDLKFNEITADDCAEREVYDFWDGSNWHKIILEDDFWPPAHQRREDLEEYDYETLASTYTGQGQGHEEYYRLHKEGEKDILIKADISYWQGSIAKYTEIDKIPDL